MTENFAIARLAALLRAGYEIDHAESEVVMLRHPQIRSVALLYADGVAVVPSKNGDRRFLTDDSQEEFYAFVRNIPKPGWRRSLRIPEWIVTAGALVIVALFFAWIRG